MNFNEELAVAGALELTDSELETAHGGWGEPEYEYVWTPEGWELVPVEPDFYGGWGGWGGWDRGGRGRGGRGRGDDFGDRRGRSRMRKEPASGTITAGPSN